MAGSSFEVHGEILLDGDASGGLAVVLYDSGSSEIRTLEANEVLHVTDVQLMCETGADCALVADSKAAGKYLFHGTLDAKDAIILRYNKPYVCPVATGLKFYGANTNLNSCIIEGWISEA